MKIGPLFKWFGSKWQSAKRYPSPEHDTIIEPFAGSAGYACNFAEKRVFLWDADDNVRDLWLWLLFVANESLIRTIPVGEPAGTDIRELGLSWGQSLLLKHWQRTNNVGDCWTISPWGHLPGQWTESTRARVAEEVYAIKHWRLDQPPAEKVGTWFIDPPYKYNYRYRRDLPPFDHQGLADMVRRIHPSSQIIVCEAACPKTGAIPQYLPFRPNHSSVTSRRKATQNHHSAELIWTNREMT